MMKKHFLLLVAMMLPLVASAYDIEVKNADGVTIYYNYTNDGAELAVTFCGTYYTDYPDEYTGNVVIPEEVTYMDKTRKVTSIGDYTFANCTNLTSVTIPNTVTSIGEYAFYWCTGLTSISIPNSVTSIGEFAFDNCSGLTSITIPNSVTSISKAAFDNCWRLTSIDIPNSVTSIGDGAFQNCSGLTSVTIPNSVTSMGDYAFCGCSGLPTVTIPNSVTSMGDGAFSYCSVLASVTIPNSVTSIGNYAFYMCPVLASVTIPNSVTSIGEYAFQFCHKLTSITIPNSVKSIGKNAFDEIAVSTIVSLIENPFAIYSSISSYKTFTLNTFNNATLYVPTGTINKYKATEGWKDFNNIVEGVPSGIKGVHLDSDKDYPVYDINGRRLEGPQRGINIINGKKVVVK